MKKILAISTFIFLGILSQAQKTTEYRFTKITEIDFRPKVYDIDSNANAVVLADIGESVIEGNTKDWFGFEYTRRKRVHILNKNGYSQADFAVYLYSNSSSEEKLTSIKAYTYNLENGKVIETKLDKSAVFTDKLDNNSIVKKFTLPAIKEGSIIDVEYTVTSDFLFNLKSWTFQNSIPTLWSEYKLSLPEFFGYIFLGQGYHPYLINENKQRNKEYHVSDVRGAGATDRLTIAALVTDYRWVMKDIPELKKESFTSTINNYVSKIEFQLSEYRHPLTYRQIMHSWPQVAKEMLERDDFGKQLLTNNGWMSDDIKPVLANATTQLEKAKNIYAFVRDNFVCTDHEALFTTQNLKSVLKTKKGNVADLNLLLTAMLKHEGITADPVILSTRDNGFTYELYPVINRFNYVACHAVIDDKPYYLDASRSRLGFGKIPYECYNGWARIINETSDGINLLSDSLKERKVTSVILIEDKGKWAGTFIQQLGDYESYSMRNKIKEEGEESFFKNLQKTYGFDVKTQSEKIDSLKVYEAPVTVRYKFTMDPGTEDMLYINPLFGEAQKENPFKSAERSYPVEMPYTVDETYVATIYVPTGYEVEEMPQQIRVKLNEQNEGMFEYAIEKHNNIISLRSRVKLERTFYAPDEYEILREFFNLIVKKQSEQIVLKKIK
jgi:transglutaminase-like putative cysteine protease